MKKTLIPLVTFFLLLTACTDKEVIKIEGNAQGTTYHISYITPDNKNYKRDIDSILKIIDLSMSTWVPNSIISKINDNDKNISVDNYFAEVFKKSIEVSEKTNGYFDITIAPLVNFWGFGATPKKTIDKSKIDSLVQLVNYKMLKLEGNKIIKQNPKIQIDFNAIAQGYSVDILANYLESKGIDNYLVELGGELKTKGKKRDENWKIGIDTPNEKPTAENPLKATIILDNKALATSGNYRKFYEENGQKFSHIINPKTGYPAKQNLLSATVIANDGITADAYATSFMVMGLEQSKVFLEKNKELKLEVYFIYDENGSWKTYISEGLKKSLQEIN
ncbi:FAD:protein FMN transferase [Flavobacterium daejeonense]|uniref:FAD:protein FMN transferase n=1 Tax=Flavobacterium daejeonense TaxID=350893 RepID=UPI000AEC3C37|nr:FAD:protein FMN transferase [Flavobacterium daejeonense]